MAGDTRHILLDTATSLVRRRGYSAFSYADLAAAVGIRKPSIHHHFPTKEDLGEALITAYTDTFGEKLDYIDRQTTMPLERLQRYAGLYREGLINGEGCLCGMLASEISILPERVQRGVRQFFALNLRWLEQTLQDGVSQGVFRRGLRPDRESRTVLSAFQGAMFVALSTNEVATFDEAVEGLFAGLRAPGERTRPVS